MNLARKRMIARPTTLAGLCLGLATFAFSTPAHADVIVSYPLDWSGGNVVETFAPAVNVHSDVTASDYIASGGSEISRNTQTHYFRVNASGNADKVDTIENAIANDVYGQFKVTVAPGMQLNLTSLDFGMGIARGADTESFTVHLRSSLDNYENDIDTATLMGDGNVVDVEGLASFDLTDAAFQNLEDSITFRLYMVSDIGSRSDGSQYIRIKSDVVLNGTTAAVPEPGSLGLLGLGGVVMLARRRRAS